MAQVSEQVGLSFATAQRAILRCAAQRRDDRKTRIPETASIAINASLTGHLVFSVACYRTTRSWCCSGKGLVDIGVKPFLVASSTRCLMAQRFVRKICKKCTAPYEPTESEMRAAGITAEMLKARH